MGSNQKCVQLPRHTLHLHSMHIRSDEMKRQQSSSRPSDHFNFETETHRRANKKHILQNIASGWRGNGNTKHNAMTTSANKRRNFSLHSHRIRTEPVMHFILLMIMMCKILFAISIHYCYYYSIGRELRTKPTSSARLWLHHSIAVLTSWLLEKYMVLACLYELNICPGLHKWENIIRLMS